MNPSDPAVPGHGEQGLRGALARIEVRLHGRLRYYDSELHGLAHLRDVALLAGRIAFESDLDVESAMIAGFLHDCGRMNDDGGNAHAFDSAMLARRLLRECFPDLDAERICRAIAGQPALPFGCLREILLPRRLRAPRQGE